METAGRNPVVIVVGKSTQTQFLDIPKTELLWTSVPIQEVIKKDYRLEAAVFDIEGRHARDVVNNCKWPVVKLWSENGIIKDAHYPGRFKRIYVDRENGIDFYLPSQLNELRPKPSKFISQKTKIDLPLVRAKIGQIFLTRSGTVGNTTLVSNSIKGKVFSDDVIRITAKNSNDVGYIYAFLKSQVGNKIIQTSNYGAVIKHIEPEHLEKVPIPNPPAEIKEAIHRLIVESFDLRDESNYLIDEAQKLLITELKLPPIEKLKPKYFGNSKSMQSYGVKMADLNNRFDGSYHLPVMDAILEHLSKHAAEITTIGDVRISEKIILPGRFKRVYVEEGQGFVFFGGKQLLELDPQGKKYLSAAIHQRRINEELKIKENTILVSRSGTIGKIMIAPKHWDNWIINEHVIRVFPSNNEIVGYIYAWLSTDYGIELIKRFTYGSVVDEIDDNHVSQVQIPLLMNREIQKEINDLILLANKKRYEAYVKEQQALKELSEKVLCAKD